MFRAAILCLLVAIAGADEPSLTPRELFYRPPAVSKDAASTPASSRRATKKTAARKTSPPPERVPVSPPPETDRLGHGATFVKAVAETSAVPLGLRYSILKEGGAGYEEADADTVFRSGDRIRVTVEANDDSFLYVVTSGSSGAWSVLFPSPEIASGDNRAVRGRRIQLPPGGRWTFDEQPGEEKLFVVLSRKPEQDLEQLIYSLGAGSAKPVSEPAAPERPKQVLLAQNLAPINDALIQRVRAEVLARDLVFEKVDDKTPGERKEKAVYVVNSSGRADSRLVADISLKHR